MRCVPCLTARACFELRFVPIFVGNQEAFQREGKARHKSRLKQPTQPVSRPRPTFFFTLYFNSLIINFLKKRLSHYAMARELLTRCLARQKGQRYMQSVLQVSARS